MEIMHCDFFRNQPTSMNTKIINDLPPPPPPPGVVVASIMGVVVVGALVVVVFSAGGKPVGATKRVEFLSIRDCKKLSFLKARAFELFHP